MPATARFVAKANGMSTKQTLTDTRYNLALGINYIQALEKQYRGNRFLALAAYNWGPANVDKTGLSGRIPRAVRHYASTILERNLSWKRHFHKAQKSVASLDQMAMLH
jgi:soluble lytic murein transglycosylase-like protein